METTLKFGLIVRNGFLGFSVMISFFKQGENRSRKPNYQQFFFKIVAEFYFIIIIFFSSCMDLFGAQILSEIVN